MKITERPMKILSLLTFTVFVFATTAYAEDSWQGNIPPQLKEWLPWVLKGEEAPCSKTVGDSSTSVCVWYPSAEIEIGEQSAKFTQSVVVEREGEVVIPGAHTLWPQNVKINDISQPVLNRNGTPSVWLTPGAYKIQGEIVWDRYPASLKVPELVGLVSTKVTSAKVPKVEVGANGTIWFRANQEVKTEEPEFIVVATYRKISDTTPVEVETVLDLNIGGRTREIVLPDLLLGTKAFEITGSLPTRLDKENRLYLRASAGTWQVRIKSLTRAPFVELVRPTLPAPLPASEVWSFEAAPTLRTVKLGGAETINPDTTEIPGEWRGLPAYLIHPENEPAALKVTEEKRASNESQSNQLGINREIKMLYDTPGYSIRDTVTGRISIDGRLNVDQVTNLGSVEINGIPQTITKLEEGGPAGVEIRSGNLSLVAQSRIAQSIREFAITGWGAEFTAPTINFFLAPGWKLLHAGGADKVSSSWVEKWNLLDIFLVLTASIAAYKIFSPGAGILTAITLVILEQEYALALNLLALLAFSLVLRFLTTGFLAGSIKVLRLIVAVGVIVTFFGFAINQVKFAIYPQLDEVSTRPAAGMRGLGQTLSSSPYSEPAAPQMAKDDGYLVGGMEVDLDALEERSATLRTPSFDDKALQRKLKKLATKGSGQNYIFDPKNITQTGFGVATFQGEQIWLSWNGPVGADERVQLFLLSPFWNLILSLLQVLLGTALIAKALAGKFDLEKLKSKLGAVSVLSILLFAGNVQAEPNFPPNEVLQELKSYALREMYPTTLCGAECATIGRAAISAEGRSLEILFEVHAETASALPIVTNLKNIELHSINSGSDKGDSPLVRRGDAIFLKAGPGVSRVKLEGSLTSLNAGLSFLVPPGRVTFGSSTWEVSGIENNTARDLKFERTAPVTQSSRAAIENDEAPVSAFLTPLGTLTRTISLEANWKVSSSFELRVPLPTLQSFTIPLLPGEAVTSPGVTLEKDAIKVVIPAGRTGISWNSVLEVQDKIELVASPESNIAEEWYIAVSNLWHTSFTGIPKTQLAGAGDGEISVWLPYPEEHLTIEVRSPEGVPGPTKTVLSATAGYSVGAKLVDAKLNFTIKSSLGQAHSIKFPTDAKIKLVSVNNTPLPSPGIKDNELTLELNPGETQVGVEWSFPVTKRFSFSPPTLNLNAPAVNIDTKVTLQNNRWTLFVTGPILGPVILFWGLFPILVFVAVLLAKSGLTPLTIVGSLLLVLGLSLHSFGANVVIYGFFLALGWRGRREFDLQKPRRWKLLQLALAAWCFIAIGTLFAAISKGLLGSPNMMIAGNNSYNGVLNWYLDVSSGALPEVFIFSLPIGFYRGAMLLWALWLAFSVIKWSVWSWKNFSSGSAWTPRK